MWSSVRKLLILPLLSTGSAHSAEWKIEPAVAVRAGYNDNLRLNIDDEISTVETALSPSTVFSVTTPESGLSGGLLFNFRRFEKDSNLDENNVTFDMNAFHRMERSQVGLNASIVKDSTLDSQLEDTGVVFDRVRRVQISGGPNWTYGITERTQASLGYGYTDVRYLNADETGFTDFTAHNFQAGLSRIISERTTTSITLLHTRNDNDNGVKSNTTNLQGGLSYQFSETLSASISAGVRRTETDASRNTLVPIFAGDTIIGFVPLAQDVSNSSSGYTFNGNMRKKFLRGETGLTASRNISNSTNGVPIEVTRLGWNNEYRFTELLSASLSVSLYSSKTDSSVTSSLNRDYYEIRPGVSWRLREFWDISASYNYKKQTFDNTSDDAVQNAAYLTLS
ncbi:MAG TPA: hypothetical protein ENK49_08895, partial [Gammaproteobacteria bacterium]|nr:hypothetical protein [Gammaproteobacteria bacterium]